MITPKIQALFKFIEYLHSNIDEFNKYNYLIDELNILYDKRNKLQPDKNYFDKKEFEKLQDEINQKNTILLQNTIQKAINRATDLNILNTSKYASIYNHNKDEAFNIINVIEDKDLPIILESKRNYIEFRTKTRNATLIHNDLYNKLDAILKVLFKYFDKKTENKFAKLPKYEGLTVIKDSSKPSRQLLKSIQERLVIINFFQIEFIADLEVDGKIYKNIKQKNGDSILTPENWEKHKDTFFNQKMDSYKDSYTFAEKIKLELSELEKLNINKLPFNKTDYQILKERYKTYLEQKQNTEFKKLEKRVDEFSKESFEFSLSKVDEFINIIKNELKQAESIAEKKRICLKHISKSKQAIASFPFTEINQKNQKPIFEPIYKSAPQQVIDWLQIELDFLSKIEASPPQQTEKIKAIKYKADEYALAYIFDLYASGKQVPINRIEGSFDAKQIKNDSTLFSSYDKTPDGFYRAVIKVVKYDLNNQMDLQNISKDWYNAVKSLSNNWLLTEQYLKDKGLVKE